MECTFQNGISTLRDFRKMECTFQNRIPTLQGFGKMECTFPEWDTHTPMFWKDGIPKLRGFGKMECTFLNRIPTLRGFGKMEYTFLEQNTHTPRFQKNAVHPSPFGSVHQTILGSPLSSFGSSQEQPVCCSCLAPQSLLNRSPPFSLDTYHIILYSQTHSGLSEAQLMSTQTLIIMHQGLLTNYKNGLKVINLAEDNMEQWRTPLQYSISPSWTKS
jgi:hypothetical protein